MRLEVRDLLRLRRIDVITPHIERVRFGAPAIRKEIHLASMPHRKRVSAFPISDALALTTLHIEEPNVGGHTAAIALPCASVS